MRFKGSPFSKAGVDNSREGIVKEIVFTRPRHDTKMPDYIAVELLLRRRLYGGVGGVHVYTHSSAVQQKAGMVFTQVVASCTDAGTSCTAPRAILDVDATNDAAGANVAAHRTAAVDKTKTDKEQAGEWISMCSSAAAGVASVGGRD